MIYFPAKGLIPMGNPTDLFQKTCADIDRHSDSTSQRYGQLLNWQDLPNPFWHYGIGLSDLYIFDPVKRCAFQKKHAKFVLGIDSIAFPPTKTIERLKHVGVFADWNYNVAGWNCEHLSRLIATGQPRCYQSKPMWRLCNLTPEGDHKTARLVFEKYLDQVNPNLN